MQLEDLKNLNSTEGKIYFEYDLKKLNWFNIGGKAKIFFKAESLKGLVEFLKIYQNIKVLKFMNGSGKKAPMILI